jgi:large subunit ribosomal protein L40e
LKGNQFRIHPLSMRFFVRTLGGTEIELDMELKDTIQSLKEKVQDKTGIAPPMQRLIYAGKVLEAYRILGDYNVQKDAKMHLIVRSRGGA